MPNQVLLSSLAATKPGTTASDGAWVWHVQVKAQFSALGGLVIGQSGIAKVLLWHGEFLPHASHARLVDSLPVISDDPLPNTYPSSGDGGKCCVPRYTTQSTSG